MMVLVGAANPLDALHRGLVADVAAERVTRIGRVNDDAAAVDDRDRLLDQPALRIVRMNFEILRHRGSTGFADGDHTGSVA